MNEKDSTDHHEQSHFDVMNDLHSKLQQPPNFTNTFIQSKNKGGVGSSRVSQASGTGLHHVGTPT
jgi:hypothetical protein